MNLPWVTLVMLLPQPRRFVALVRHRRGRPTAAHADRPSKLPARTSSSVAAASCGKCGIFAAECRIVRGVILGWDRDRAKIIR